ncbi:hypothetical protein ACFQ0Q_15980 [Streptomyces aureus]
MSAATLDPACAGRIYPPTEPYEVGREKIRSSPPSSGRLPVTAPSRRPPSPSCCPCTS